MKLFFTDACLSLFLLLLTTTGASKSTSSASFTSPTADHSFDNDAAKDTADNLARQLLGRELDRQLEAGDFDSFNELLENAKIVIDDEFEVKEKAGLWTLVLWLSNIRCFEISVQDIVVEHSQPSNTQVDVSIDIVELDLTCDVDYRYDYGPFRGSGWVRVFTDNNKASTDLRFVSPSFDTHPPLSSSVTDCVTDIEITNMEFNGGIVANLVDLFERLIRNPIEGAIEGVACDELGSLGTSFVTDMLDVADEVLFQYEGDLGDEINDPLYLEITTQLPETIQPLNLQDTDSLLGGWVSKALEVADNLLGSRVPDPENDSQDDDLGVNILLRTHLLDENRALVVDVAQLMDNNVLFEGHDKLTETSIALNSIKVLGLDTLTRFNPMIAIGQRTLQNELTWEYLTLEFDVTVSVKPSSKTDAILQDATSEGITERISIDFTIPDVDIVASLFLVIDQEALGSMEIGPLLHFDNLLPCLLSIIPIVELSGLEVSPTLNVNTPTLNGFSSPGLDRLLSNSIQAAFDMYKGVLTTRLPNIFQTSVRNLINRDIIGEYMEENPCPSGQGTVSDSQFVDFRDFFESNDYGNLPPLLKNLVDDELLATDPETGKPRINEILITPYTKAQSGVEGSLKFANELFAFSSKAIPQFGLDSIQLQVFDVAIENLDTLGAPLELLQPNSTNGFVLDNYVTFDGNATESLRFSIKGLFALNGGPELEISNEMELSLAIEEPELFASILAKVDSEALASFPLGNIIDGNCWLALLATPLMGESGYIVSSAAKGLSLETLLLSYPSFQFDLSCSNCTNSGSDVIPALLEGLEDIGVSESLEQRLFALGLDLVRSDFFQAYLNRLVVDGSLRCPHSPYFEGESASSNYPIPSLPSLSYESLESVAFASTILMQVAIVVIAESHAYYDAGENDPLSGQALLDASSAYNFVDFMSLESSIGEWADVAVDQLLDYLSATIDDPKGEDGKDLRINSLIRSTLLDEAGLLEIMFDDLNFGGDNMEVSLEDIRVVGLDTISSFDILDAIGSQTLRNRVKWDNVGIEVIVSLMVTEDSSRRLNTQEDITIYLELSEIDVSLALLLAMDLDLLGSIELSSMLEVKNILPCLLTAAREAELTELQVVIGSISEFSINGFRSSELQDFSTKSTRFIMDSFGDIILSSMPGFFDRTVRALLNNWIDYYMGDSSNVACDSVSFEGTTSSFVDFRDLFLSAATSRLFGGSGLSPYGDLFKTALEFVQDLVLKIDASTGLSKINDILIAPLTRSQSESAGTLVVPGDLFNSGSRVQVGGLDANVQLRASDARVDNLDTIVSPLAVLEAVDGEAHELNNTVTFGVTDRPLRFAVRFLFSLIGDDMQIRNDLDISLDLSNANVVLQAMLKVAESSFYTFPLRDTLDYNCWLAMMPAPELDSSGIRVEGSEATARLTELAASISHLNLNISCVECSGPRMIELTELLSSTEGQEAATEIANTLLGYVAELLGGNFLEIKIDRLLKDAARKCPHSPTYEADAEEMEYEPFEEPNSEGSISFLILIGGVTVGLILCLCVLLSSIRCFVRRRHKKWLSGLSARQLQRLVSQQDKEQEVESELNASTQSMFTSQDIPIFVRWSMPLIILANIGFFLSGHLSLGATVHIELQLAGEKFGVDQFFEFSMAKSTIDIWNAGGRELAIMILIFSVIWPYTKQLITLVLWFLPPTKLSVSRRGSILLWLDCLGKWSMIDIFVLVITLVAFRVSIVSPSIGFLPENFYSINLLVVPLWGLYANMIAQLVSQVSSHFIIHYHRNIIHEARKAPQGESLTNAGKSTLTVEQACDISTSSDRREVVHDHSFGRPHRGESDKLVIRRWVNKSLWLVTACLVALVAVGSTLPAFSIDILGLIGVAVESGQRFEDATTQYSVFTVVQLLMEEAQFLDTLSDYIGLGSLSLLLVFSVLLVPIVQGATLLYQWSKPTTSRGKARIAIFIEILQAWQYAEVYLIAIFVASWQLGPVSQFMVNSYCDSLKDTFAQLVYYGILKEEDAQCFSVQSSIEDGSFILAAGAVLLALLNTVVNKAIVQYFRDNNNRKGMRNDDEEKVIESEIVNQSIDRMIHPVPVLFSDTFRWLLVRSSDFVSSSRALFAPLEEPSEIRKGGESIIQRGVEIENEALKDNPANGDNLSRSTEKPDSSSSMHVSD